MTRDMTSSSLRVAFGGAQVGVLVTFALRDPLATFVCLLEDGALPKSPGEMTPTTTIHEFHLPDIEALCGIEPSSKAVYGLPTRQEFDNEAARLRTVAFRLLQGDLAMIPPLQQRILDRARDFAITKWGPHASDFGW
jgi:hypothetical protein